uniref:Uncharacterized protein n=1 Tax=Strombidium inclinatum TaxID=197538 RepID=A0A7S3IM19_9SPIT|mmetsp:Transcript_27944/g.42234  ORF Transcript_27944/g.42234 Transcript_27944/m.42234 type:complete len:223 (+) Transcript_27944:1036-1704(+)
MSFSQLYTEYVRVKKERQRFKLLKSKGKFTVTQLKKYVERYLKVVERNEESIQKRLIELTDAHIDRIDGIEPDIMSLEEQIKTVLEYYNQSIDKDNPLRDGCIVDEAMHGRMQNTIHSYDLMDNPKYKRIDRLLDIMQETFGFNEEIHGLIKTSITEADFLLAKSSIEMKKILSERNENPTTNDQDQSKNSSMRSDQELKKSMDSNAGNRLNAHEMDRSIDI